MAIRYTHKEEMWNTFSHAGGILLGVCIGIIFLFMTFSNHSSWSRLLKSSTAAANFGSESR